MTLSVKELLCQTPREVAGARSADRFDYQLDWALGKLIALHDAGGDYVMLLDHHDDVVVATPSDDPTEIRLYQVKTKGPGHWTLAALITRSSGGTSLSILGKLYDHRIRFGTAAVELALVSNAVYRVTRSGASQPSFVEAIDCTELSAIELQQIVDALRAEHGLSDVPEITGMCLQHSDLPLARHGRLVEGEIGRFLERRVPNGAFRTPSIYRTIKDELQRRNNHPSPSGEFEDVVRAKGLSRAEFEAIVARVARTANPFDRWRSIAHDLSQAGVAWKRLEQLAGEYQRVDAELLDPNNVLVLDLYRSAKSLLRQVPSLFEDDDNRATVLRKVSQVLEQRESQRGILRSNQAAALVLHAMEDV